MRHRKKPIPEHLQYPREGGFLDDPFQDTPPESQLLTEQDRNCDNETYENLDLRHIDFREASLVNTKFINCDLRGCGFVRANCENATFKECDLRNSFFSLVRLNGSKFELSNLQCANLTYAEMPNIEAFDRANIEGTRFTDVALFFAYLQYKRGELPHLSVIGVPQFEDLYVSDSDLQGADLKGVHIRSGSFVRANLQGAKLSDAEIYATNFQSATLSGANLSNAHLSDANLLYASLREVNLNGARYNKNTKGLTQSQKAVMIEVD